MRPFDILINDKDRKKFCSQQSASFVGAEGHFLCALQSSWTHRNPNIYNEPCYIWHQKRCPLYKRAKAGEEIKYFTE